MCEIWVEKQPTVEFDEGSVRITYSSGTDVYRRRVSRAWFRRYLEANLRKLNAYEEAERAKPKVVRMQKRGH
jgi:hypothetical protein